jgi:hypothetical protein
MQRYLAFVNMPSRNDVVGLGETLRSIEDRLRGSKRRCRSRQPSTREAVDAAYEPARTRQAPVFPTSRRASLRSIAATLPLFRRSCAASRDELLPGKEGRRRLPAIEWPAPARGGGQTGRPSGAGRGREDGAPHGY